MPSRKINIQLRRILGIRIAESHVANIRHLYLNYNYRRSKCKPHEFNEFEKRRRLLFAINNINNNMETTVFVDESSCWTLCEGLYFMRRKSSLFCFWKNNLYFNSFSHIHAQRVVVGNSLLNFVLWSKVRFSNERI